MEKAAIRSLIRDRRAARELDDGTDVATQALALLPQSPATIAVYLSLPGEPVTDALIERLLDAGHRVVAPRILGNTDLEWLPIDAETMYLSGPFGIREPAGIEIVSSLAWVDVVIMPALAVDVNGRRLGQGGGFFDRALAGVRSHAEGGPLRIALVFEDEVLADVAAEPHDLAVDAAVTPSGVREFSQPE